MKSQRLLKFRYILILTIVLISSCRDDKDNDICDGVKPVSAEFSVGAERRQNSWAFGDTTIIFDSDTVSIPFVFFTANNDADSYAWRIGDDPRVFEQKSFELQFDPSLHESTVSVSLVSTKSDPDCLTDMESVDSVSRDIFLFNGPQGPSYLKKIVAKWHGSTNEFPDEEFTFETLENYKLTGFPNNCSDYHSGVGSYNEIFVSTPNQCGWFYGRGKVSDDWKTFVFDYSISYDEGITINDYTFAGTRVE